MTVHAPNKFLAVSTPMQKITSQKQIVVEKIAHFRAALTQHFQDTIRTRTLMMGAAHPFNMDAWTRVLRTSCLMQTQGMIYPVFTLAVPVLTILLTTLVLSAVAIAQSS
mmetsp:Transcript_14989/g.37410  ORF Transcript_14989/g.37410 Transcript_14989/m.37410 type:complete len:109 (+) Transcript_14989:73-399(+)